MQGILSYNRGVLVTPSDTVDILDKEFSALYVGGVGDVTVVYNDGSTVKYSGMLAGTIYRIRGFKRINATGTTATLLAVLYGQ